MELVRSRAELQALRRRWQREQAVVGFVPTMGYLHAGHISLFDVFPAAVTHRIASIYVNPTQFGANEDLSRYPTDLDGDISKLEAAGCDALFLPANSVLYPEGVENQVVFVQPGSLGSMLCGKDRPTHFRGVLTVVSKLFHLVCPDFAVFGEKDFQQLRLIETMVRDLDFPIRILCGPTGREEDGLALSSRNRYLTAEERAKAPALHQTLLHAGKELQCGALPELILATGMARLEASWGSGSTDYFECRREQDLQPATLKDLESVACRLFAAGRLGHARLIDNLKVAATRNRV